MPTNLATRLDRLEEKAAVGRKPYPKVVRIVLRDGEEVPPQMASIGEDGASLLIITRIVPSASAVSAGAKE